MNEYSVSVQTKNRWNHYLIVRAIDWNQAAEKAANQPDVTAVYAVSLKLVLLPDEVTL